MTLEELDYLLDYNWSVLYSAKNIYDKCVGNFTILEKRYEQICREKQIIESRISDSHMNFKKNIESWEAKLEKYERDIEQVLLELEEKRKLVMYWDDKRTEIFLVISDLEQQHLQCKIDQNIKENNGWKEK